MLPILIGAGVVAFGSLWLGGCGGEGARLNYPPDASRDTSSPPPPPPPPPPINTPPEIEVRDSYTAYQGFPIDIPITATDREGGDVRVEVEGLASTRSSFRIVEQRAGSTRANLRWASTCTASVGEYMARIRATDEGGVSSEREVSIDLQPATAITGQYEVSESLSLCNGIYNGLRLSITGLDLVLEGNGSTLTNVASQPIEIASGRYNVTVQHFNIRGLGPVLGPGVLSAGVRVYNARNVNLRNLFIEAVEFGILVFGSSTRPTSGFLLEHSTIQIVSSSGALSFDNSNDVIIRDVTFRGSGANPTRARVISSLVFGLVSFANSTNVRVENCRISGGDGNGGISLDMSNGVVVRDSTIEQNWESGVHLRAANRVEIYNNTIRSNFACGILTENGSTYTESGNTITGHTQSYCSR